MKLISNDKIRISNFLDEYLGPVSYEMHLGNSIMIIEPISKSFEGSKPKEKVLKEIKIQDDGYTLRPKQFIIAKTLESVYCDEDIVGIFDGKASLAQIGLFTNISSTLVEPLTDSSITCEIFNCSNFPIKLFKKQKIGQIFFSGLG